MNVVRGARPLANVVAAVVAAAIVAAGTAGCAHSGAGSAAAGAGGSRPGSPKRVASTASPTTPGPKPTTGPKPSTGPTTTGPTATTGPAPAPSTTAAPAVRPDRRAPFPVRELTIPFVDTSRPTVGRDGLISHSRALTTEVWVPEGGGRFPLIVFAPGFAVGPNPYQTLLEAWAAQGYVVAAVEFPLTDAAVAGPNLDENDLNNQPADLRFVTDGLVAPTSPVAGQIDRSRVALAGHSDGAESALEESIEPIPPGQPAYRAVIVMSGQPLLGIATTPNPPILVIQGDADTINPPARGYRTWQVAASPKYLEVLHGAGHLPPLEAGSEWLSVIERVTDAFLDAYVAGTASPSTIARAGDDPPLATIQTG